MRHVLRLHPDSHCLAVAQMEVVIARPQPGRLVLSYIVTGKMSDVRMPPVVASARSDELWRHTCFEAFVRASPGEEYYEFNFGPSTQWAAYRFGSYRSGMRVAAEISANPIEVTATAGSFILEASLDLDRLELPREVLWRLGLSALIEETSGRKSYWALAHPPGRPDFHHADSFAHELFPAVQP
jgi:hypothetical protein